MEAWECSCEGVRCADCQELVPACETEQCEDCPAGELYCEECLYSVELGPWPPKADLKVIKGGKK